MFFSADIVSATGCSMHNTLGPTCKRVYCKICQHIKTFCQQLHGHVHYLKKGPLISLSVIYFISISFIIVISLILPPSPPKSTHIGCSQPYIRTGGKGMPSAAGVFKTYRGNGQAVRS